RQSETVGDQETFLARRDVELRVVFELQEHRESCRRLVGEIQADTRLNDLRLSRGLQVCVEDQIGALVESQRHAVRLRRRHSPRLPEQQMTVGIEYLGFDADLHSSETRSGLALAAA